MTKERINIQKIHEATMELVEKAGMKFHHPEAVEILKAHGIRMEGNVAHFTEEQLMYWVRKAPATFKIYARNPKYDMVIGGDRVNCAPAYGSPFISDQDGKTRDATIEDYVKFTKLFHMNQNFDMNGGIICMPDDVPVDNATLLMFYAAFTHSDKCMFAGSGKREQLEAMFEMAKAAYGSEEDLIAYPRFTTIVNVNTPLQFAEGMTETLMTFVKYGQPIIVAACDMAGTTAPITLAGMMTLTNAEVLCTIALAEMIRPGTPVIYGSQSTGSNLRNGAITSGSPEGAIAYKYAAKLAKYYGLPCRGGGSVSDAKVVDAQAGYESMLTFMVCSQSEMNLIVHAAGILDGYNCISFEKLMLDFQVVDYVKRYLKDIESDGDRIPLELMISQGQSGQYLTEEHTLDYCREEPLDPFLSVSGPCSDPKNQFGINIDKAIAASLEKYKMPDNDPAVLEKMRAVLLARGVDPALLDKIEAL